jgi:hypothetical protein
MRAIWTSTLRTTAFALLAGALAVALGATAAAPASRAQVQNLSKEQLAAQRNAELQVLKERATNLAKQINAHSSASPMRSDQQREWIKLLSDFDQWAAKFHVPTQEQMLPAYGVSASGHQLPKNYPLLAEGAPGVAGFFCMKDLSRSTDAQFAYRCYRE